MALVSPPASSANARATMRANKGKNTKPELIVRKMLRNAGHPGYRLHWTIRDKDGRVICKPDICYPGKKIAIFVHGCFWHRCPRCALERDRRKEAALLDRGWRVHTIWECDVEGGFRGIALCGGGGEAVTKTEEDLVLREWVYFVGLTFSVAALVAIVTGKWGWAIFCFIPVSMLFAWGGWSLGEQDRVTRRYVKLRKKRVEDRRTAALTWKRDQFATWVMKKYNVEILHDPKSPEYKRKWGEWQQEIKDLRAAADKKGAETRRRNAAAKKAEAAKKKAAAAKKKAAAAKKKAAAAKKKAAKKKQISKNQASLRKALVDIQKKGLSRKIDNVSRHSYQSLLSVTTRFEGIRKNGTLDQLNKSILSNIGSWTTQLTQIQKLDAEMTKDPALEDLLRMEQHSSIDKTRVKHPELKKKATNLRGRIERRKEKLGRVRKEAAFSRPMLQTQDVPNATLLRKEKAWKLNDGCCTRCDKPSSEMAFYWDVYPDLLLVVICDDCAAKEEFVHAQEPDEDVGGDVDDLADVFMRAVGTSEKKSRKK